MSPSPSTPVPRITRTPKALPWSLILLVALLAALLGPVAAQAADVAGPEAGKRGQSKIDPGESRDSVQVKFTEGTDVRLRGGKLVSARNGAIQSLDDVLRDFPGVRARRLFPSVSEGQLDASREGAERRSGRNHADLNLWFSLDAKKGTDAEKLIADLNRLELVEVASPAPEPVRPPTPSFVSRQGYRSAASASGIDAVYANGLTGGRGENVTIADIEYSWNKNHEDLSKARAAGATINNGTPCDPYGNDHGTAVLGEIVADENAFGVTGLAPRAGVKTSNSLYLDAYGRCGTLNIANAITAASNNLAQGDVILIEQHIPGPNHPGGTTQFGLVPAEWNLATWQAIRQATDNGRIVVQAAGNGSQNLDAPEYNDSTGRSWFSYDSGAIVVGAGSSPDCGTARSRLGFSNYGNRVNVQAWGNCVTTTGYGGLQGSSTSNDAYSAEFSGTSSASPIVASAAGIVSSVKEAAGASRSPAEVRSLLVSTGQAQVFGTAGKIGPLPNLRAALPTQTTTKSTIADAGHRIGGTTVGATTVPVRQSWKLTAGSTPTEYEMWMSTDGGGWVRQTTTASSAVFNLTRNHSYRFAARAKNSAGVWGDFAYGTTFNVGEYQENSSTLAYAGSWTRAAYAPAIDGYLNVAGTTGSSVSFSFTGDNVAWIGTKATNRGQARVYVDGVHVQTVDMYAATTTARAVVFQRSWASVGSHTIKIVSVGTAGRPKIDVDAFVRLR